MSACPFRRDAALGSEFQHSNDFGKGEANVGVWQEQSAKAARALPPVRRCPHWRMSLRLLRMCHSRLVAIKEMGDRSESVVEKKVSGEKCARLCVQQP
jgi:hypothetical protein